MTLPPCLRPRLPWYHWSRAVGFYRRVRGTVRRQHSAEELKFQIYGTVTWRDGEREVATDLLAWRFYGPIDPEGIGQRRVLVGVLEWNSPTSRDKMSEAIENHPIREVYGDEFLATGAQNPTWYSQAFLDGVARSNSRIMADYEKRK